MFPFKTTAVVRGASKSGDAHDWHGWVKDSEQFVTLNLVISNRNDTAEFVAFSEHDVTCNLGNFGFAEVDSVASN
jgi:hypothetical protein